MHLFIFSGRASLSEKPIDNEKAGDRTKNTLDKNIRHKIRSRKKIHILKNRKKEINNHKFIIKDK